MDSSALWPPHFKDILIIGNKNAPVGVCTLWTLRDKIAAGLDPNSYALVGNMFYNEGINYLIRTVFANPHIHHIILCGTDISKSGETFLKFMEHGVDSEHRIIGTDVQLHQEIPCDALDLFRTQVTVTNLIGSNDTSRIAEAIAQVKQQEPFTTPREFPLPTIKKAETFPSHPAMYTVRDKTIAKTWKALVRHIMRFGYVKQSEQSSDMREVINAVAIIDAEDPKNPYLPEYLPISKEDINGYLPKILTAEIPDGTQYTYGNRLRDHRVSKNQIEHMIAILKRNDYSRRAVAITWDHVVDSVVHKNLANENPPCWLLLQSLVQQKKLYLTCYIRSNDIYAAWPLNAFGLLSIQDELAGALGLDRGSLTIISASAHIYAHDFAQATEMIEKHDHVFYGIENDPRGYFRIDLDREHEEIVVMHFAPDGTQIDEIRAKTGEALYKKLEHVGAALVPAHWAHLGYQIARAEIALKNKLKFTFDEPGFDITNTIS